MAVPFLAKMIAVRVGRISMTHHGGAKKLKALAVGVINVSHGKSPCTSQQRLNTSNVLNIITSMSFLLNINPDR